MDNETEVLRLALYLAADLAWKRRTLEEWANSPEGYTPAQYKEAKVAVWIAQAEAELEGE